jgi:DNA-binding beta-propeller fold protein YncE
VLKRLFFASASIFLLALAPIATPGPALAEGYVYLAQWGTEGTGNGQFEVPTGVAVDASGYVYVVDSYNNRIQKFTSTGTYLTQWGTPGSGNGQFSFPYGVAVDASGNVYVADTGNYRIQKFTSTGTYLTQWGTYGSGNEQFQIPFGIAVDASGYVYVDDLYNRIQKFSGAGTYITQWGTFGSGNGQFATPYDVAVDASGYVYVADTNNNRVQKFRQASQVSVPGEAPIAFALDPVRPNPVRGSALTMHFTLASAAAASLELLDMAGRRVSAREVGQLGAGRHALDFGAGRSLAPGIYVVRLQQGTNVKVVRAAVLE